MMAPRMFLQYLWLPKLLKCTPSTNVCDLVQYNLFLKKKMFAIHCVLTPENSNNVNTDNWIIPISNIH
jgi:hypothetical protein